jgi:predicted anti-sigma-YlaC factor YlaD
MRAMQVCLNILMVLWLVATSGCSIQRLAVNRVGDALAAGGTTFAADDDPELIKAAVPFSLKLMESLLDENPRHAGLLFATSSGFTQYTYAYVQQEADELEEKDFAAALRLRKRAGRLYLRARNYGLRGLELTHPGITKTLQKDARLAVQVLNKEDVPQAYWCALSWFAAIAVSKDNPDLIADLPQAEALMDRALTLDERFEAGALHAFYISYEFSRQGVAGDPLPRARAHYERALALSGGQQASPFVSWAEAVCVQQQDLDGFKAQLGLALSIDVDAKPPWRLANLIMQRRARWLLSRTDELFLPKPNK